MKTLLSMALVVFAVPLFAAGNPIAGVYQGPCTNFADRDNSFTYVYDFKALTDDSGYMTQTRTYYKGKDCKTFLQAGGFDTDYVVRPSAREGVWEIDVSTRGEKGKTYYDIFTITENKGFTFLTFGETWKKTNPDERPTVLSDRDRIFIKIDR